MSEEFVFEEPAITYNILDDGTAFSLIRTIKEGIQFNLFKKLTHGSPFTGHDWSSFLHLSERSLQRYKKEGGRFGPVSSEKIIEIIMLYKYGVAVFGDKEKFNTWLVSKNVALGGVDPKSLLDTSVGIQIVKNELTRIEHGVLA
ncbi:MAG: DUF2384 domain-containing protein [Bacteroidales bacterium]|nr:DUF2384 domain-containing protein [Bacteroidales bacterium]